MHCGIRSARYVGAIPDQLFEGGNCLARFQFTSPANQPSGRNARKTAVTKRIPTATSRSDIARPTQRPSKLRTCSRTNAHIAPHFTQKIGGAGIGIQNITAQYAQTISATVFGRPTVIADRDFAVTRLFRIQCVLARV